MIVGGGSDGRSTVWVKRHLASASKALASASPTETGKDVSAKAAQYASCAMQSATLRIHRSAYQVMAAMSCEFRELIPICSSNTPDDVGSIFAVCGGWALIILGLCIVVLALGVLHL